MTRPKKKRRDRSSPAQVLAVEGEIEEGDGRERVESGEGGRRVREVSSQRPGQGESALGPGGGARPPPGVAESRLRGPGLAGQEPLSSLLHRRPRGEGQPRGQERQSPEGQHRPREDAGEALQRASAVAPVGAPIGPRARAVR